MRLLAPTCKQLTPQITATVRETNLHPSFRSAWHLQTAQSANNNQTHKRTEFQSTYIGLCLPIAVLQCDPATQRSSNAHLGVAAQLRCDAHDHTGLDNTCAERHQQRGVGWCAHVYLTPASLLSNPRNQRIWGVLWCGGGNLHTKLSRCCGGVVYMCLGCTDRSSAWAQPNSPPQPPTLASACAYWSAGTQK